LAFALVKKPWIELPRVSAAAKNGDRDERGDQRIFDAGGPGFREFFP
jgi:hypothetical protein